MVTQCVKKLSCCSAGRVSLALLELLDLLDLVVPQ